MEEQHFSQSFQNFYFPALQSFCWLVDLHETCAHEPRTFRVMNIPKKPQAAMPSSFNIEVLLISPFHLPYPHH